MISEVMWVEKHRPESLDDIVGNEEIVASLQEWAETGECPHVLLYGPPGTGKTALTTAFAKDFYGDDWRGNFMEMNASDDRGIDIVRDQIKTYAKQGTTGGYPFKILFLDEADALTKEAQQALRRVMEDYSDNTRFFLSCNWLGQLRDPIQSRCAPFNVSPLSVKQVRGILRDIADKEGVECSDESLDAIAESTGGDARSAIMALQAASTGDRITEDSIEAVTGIVDQGLIETAVQEAMAGNLDEAQKIVHVDLLKEGVDSQTLANGFVKVLKKVDIPEDSRIKAFDKLGEAEWRATQGANPHVQWSAFIAHLCIVRHLSLDPYQRATDE